VNLRGGRNWLWRLRTYFARELNRTPVIGRGFARVHDRLFARKFGPDLQQINDVLRETNIAGRYWVWGGVLLGVAREGAPLAHDRDVDFAILREDYPLLLTVIPALRAAGFIPLGQYRNNRGEVTELTFRKHGGRFEFFLFEPVDEMLRYFVFGQDSGRNLEVELAIPNQKLESFEMLGRKWLRHVDYQYELECIYGDWRIPDRTWNYLIDDHSAIETRPWIHSNTSWTA